MNLRIEHNRLFFNDKEVCEFSTAGDNPAHHQKIICAALSRREGRAISADAGSIIKIWEPALPKFHQRVWHGDGFGSDVCAVGVTDDGQRFAVSYNLTVTIYDADYNMLCQQARNIGTITLPLTQKITSLRFDHKNRITCYDVEGKAMAIVHDPGWHIDVVR